VGKENWNRRKGWEGGCGPGPTCQSTAAKKALASLFFSFFFFFEKKKEDDLASKDWEIAYLHLPD
jgi:hypothetical protein